MRRFRINIASTRLAFFLIALVVVQILISAIVPQKGLVEEQIIGMRSMLGEDNAVVRILQLDRIFFSPVFLISLGLLTVNLLAGNIKRFRTVLRVEGTLLKARHLGSITFHLALLMVISGVMLHSLYRFDGAFGITEGQRVLDEESNYFYIDKGSLSREPAGKFALILEDIDREFPVKDATTEAATVVLEPLNGGAPVKGRLRINQPFRWGGFEFHYGALTGYSPEVLVLDSSGEVLFRRFVRMKVRKSGNEWIHADFIELPDSRIRVEVHINEGVGQGTPPGRRLSVTKGDSTLFEGDVAAGDTVVAGEIRVAVPRVRNWCYLHAVRNPWLWLVFTGFWVGLAGLTITVLPRAFPKKERRS
jgi:hypothetical protein